MLTSSCNTLYHMQYQENSNWWVSSCQVVRSSMTQREINQNKLIGLKTCIFASDIIAIPRLHISSQGSQYSIHEQFLLNT